VQSYIFIFISQIFNYFFNYFFNKLKILFNKKHFLQKFAKRNTVLALLNLYRFVLFFSFLRKQESLVVQAIAGQARNDR